MTRECERVGGINLGQGICDLPTLPAVADGAIDAIRKNLATYTVPEGIEELRAAIAKKLARVNGIEADAASEIVITNGATGAFTSAATALFDPGDGIVLFEPYYGYHMNTLVALGLEPQTVPLVGPRFALDEPSLRDAIRPNTRAIVVCTPGNPSGKMFDRAELEAIGRVARDHDLWIITDEIYEYFRYDGRQHISPATVASLGERTITIMGLSKTFSITGWRLGYLVAPADIARAINLVNDVLYVCAPAPLQRGAVRGFSAPVSYFDGLRTTYQRKRDSICSALEKAGLRPAVPEGAYYVLADISSLGFTGAREAAMALLARTQVAAIPGTSFFGGKRGESFLRFCFAKDDDVLAEACARLASFSA
jgi:aminotransferase